MAAFMLIGGAAQASESPPGFSDLDRCPMTETMVDEGATAVTAALDEGATAVMAVNKDVTPFVQQGPVMASVQTMGSQSIAVAVATQFKPEPSSEIGEGSSGHTIMPETFSLQDSSWRRFLTLT